MPKKKSTDPKKKTAPEKGPSKPKKTTSAKKAAEGDVKPNKIKEKTSKSTSAKTSATKIEKIAEKPATIEKKPRQTSAKQKEPEYPIPVEKPAAPLKEVAILKDKPERPHTRKPDPWPDLPEKVRSYLKLWPYGSNIVVDRRRIHQLQNFFIAIRELPLPDTLWKELNKFQNEVRDIIELISVEEFEVQNQARLKEHWEPFNPNYNCKCHTRKRRAPKAKKQTSEDDD